MSNVASLDDKRQQRQQQEIANTIAKELGVDIGELADITGTNEESVQTGLLDAVQRHRWYDAIDERRRQKERDQGKDPDECHNACCKHHVSSEFVTNIQAEDGSGTYEQFSGRQHFCASSKMDCMYRMSDSPPASPFVPEISHAECVRILQRIGYVREGSFEEHNGTNFMFHHHTRKLWVAFVHLLVETGRLKVDPVELAKHAHLSEEHAEFCAMQDDAKQYFGEHYAVEPLETKLQRDALLAWIRGEIEWPDGRCPCGGDVGWNGVAHTPNCRFAGGSKKEKQEELLKTDPYEPIPTGFLIEQACPFCGAWFAYLHHVTDDNRQHVCKIVCLRCGAGAPDNVGDEFHSTVEKSVAAWNERPPEQADRDRYTKHKDNSEE